jgi:hypothetical protein
MSSFGKDFFPTTFAVVVILFLCLLRLNIFARCISHMSMVTEKYRVFSPNYLMKFPVSISPRFKTFKEENGHCELLSNQVGFIILMSRTELWHLGFRTWKRVFFKPTMTQCFFSRYSLRHYDYRKIDDITCRGSRQSNLESKSNPESDNPSPPPKEVPGNVSFNLLLDNCQWCEI